MISSCSQLFYYPNSILYSDPQDNGFKLNEVRFETKDGHSLHGWHFPNTLDAKKPKGLVLFFHGNAQNISAHYPHLMWAREQGLDYFIFDYRGYGLSEGSPHQPGLYLDAMAALKLVHEWKEERDIPKLIVYGQSLGGAVAARALEDDPKLSEIDLLVFDSTFTSYTEVASRKLGRAWPLAYVLVSDEYSPKESYSKFKNPVLVIHSKADRVVEYQNGRDVFSLLATDKKWFWELENAPHSAVFFVKEGHYRKKFMDLVDSLSPNSDKQ